MWALIIEGKVQELTAVDPAGRYHESLIWVECAEAVSVGWTFSDGMFSAPPAPTLEALVADAMLMRDALLSQAQVQIAPLQYAKDGQIATPTEEGLLDRWKLYCIDVSRIQQQARFPTEISWPAAPNSSHQ